MTNELASVTKIMIGIFVDGSVLTSLANPCQRFQTFPLWCTLVLGRVVMGRPAVIRNVWQDMWKDAPPRGSVPLKNCNQGVSSNEKQNSGYMESLIFI